MFRRGSKRLIPRPPKAAGKVLREGACGKVIERSAHSKTAYREGINRLAAMGAAVRSRIGYGQAFYDVRKGGWTGSGHE